MTTTTQEIQDKPKSYTQRLMEHLEENKVSKKTLSLIKEFSSAESLKIQEKRESNKGIMNFGKYKGKRLEEVFKLDKQYVEWLNKNNNYLNSDNKEIVAQLLS